MPVRVVVGTCQRYASVLSVWYKAAEKFWPEGAVASIVCTDENPEIPNVPAARVMAYDGGWCDRLIACLEDIADDFVVLVLDDYILEAPIEHKQVLDLQKRMVGDTDIGVIYLTDIGLESVSTDRYGVLDIVNGPYSVNSCPGLWRREFLLDTLRPFQDPWAWETFAFGIAVARRYKALCVSPSLYQYSYKTGGLVYRGMISKIALRRIKHLTVELAEIRGFELETDTRIAKRSFQWKLKFLSAGWRVSPATFFRFIRFGLRKKLQRKG